jgi:hypothetical protein
MIVITQTDLDQPLSHARIFYQNILTRENLTGTSGLDNFPLFAVVNRATYERYVPSSMPATLHVDAGSAVTVDYFAIAAHTLFSAGCTVSIESSDDNDTWTQQQTFAVSDNRATIGLFDSVSARYWRLVMSGGSAPEVGVFFLGKSLAMQRAIYAGHSPLLLSRVTAVRPSLSETGQWLGATLERKGFKASFSWQNLTAAWYRQNFDLFAKSNPRANPFFISWRPETFAQEVAYCWTTSDITPSNTGPRDLMSVSIDVEAYSDE